MKNRWFKRLVILVILFSFLSLSMSSCYGSFALTTKIYQWNGTLGGTIVNSIVMFLLLVIPVYEVCLFVDWVLLNTIEFLTGSPIIGMDSGSMTGGLALEAGKKSHIDMEKKSENHYVIHIQNDGQLQASVDMEIFPDNACFIAKLARPDKQTIMFIGDKDKSGNFEMIYVENFNIQTILSVPAEDMKSVDNDINAIIKESDENQRKILLSETLQKIQELFLRYGV